MAIESQGIGILRAATEATCIGNVDNTSLAVVATGISMTTGGVGSDFLTSSFSTGMRVIISGGAENVGKVFTIKSISAEGSVIGFYETATAEDATGLSIQGIKMEKIGSVISFSGPSGSAGVIDVTTMDSTAKEKMIGLQDEGQVSMECLLSSSATDMHSKLRDDRANRRKGIFAIQMTDGSTPDGYPTKVDFDAYVTGFALSGGVDNVVKASISMELTSACKWREGVST